MSYARFRREALDETLPANVRAKALRSAVQLYIWPTRTSFTSVLEELARRHGFFPPDRPPARRIAPAMRDLDGARATFLAALARYSAFRRAQKAVGVRCPAPSLEAALFACVTLGKPRPR